MAISSTMVWEVRSAGSVTLNGGGGFKPGASGTDYSQQNAVQYALTAVTTAGVSDTMLTASASVDMIGNTCQITAGTNFTTGYYEIIAAVAGVSIQVDRNCATAAGAAGVVKIGGATATLGSIGVATAIQPGNLVWIKGAFSGLNSDSVGTAGTASLPVILEGYSSTRGDGYLGRTSNNGPLITTNFPSLTYTGSQRLNPSGTYQIYKYLTIITNNATGSITTSANDQIISCNIVNNNATAAAIGLSIAAAGDLAFNCDVSLPSGVAGSVGITAGATGSKAVGCRVSNAGGTGISITAGGAAINNLIYSSGIGIATVTVTTSSLIWGNTIANITGDGINIITATTAASIIGMNMITDCGGFGLNMVSTSNPAQVLYNRFRDNTSGNIGNASASVTAGTFGSVTSGNGTSDYVNAAGGNYNLKTTSPAVNAGIPYAASMGAYQLPSTGGGGGGSYAFVG